LCGYPNTQEQSKIDEMVCMLSQDSADLRLEVGAAHAGNAEAGRRSGVDSSKGRVMPNRFITKEFFK
jgi:hypothetical protein